MIKKLLLISLGIAFCITTVGCNIFEKKEEPKGTGNEIEAAEKNYDKEAEGYYVEEKSEVEPMQEEEESQQQEVYSHEDIQVQLAMVESTKGWDSFLMGEIGESVPIGSGFLMESQKKKIILGIKNNMEKTIDDVWIDYEIITYEIGEGGSDKVYKESENRIFVGKVDSGQVVKCDVSYMGTFPRVDVKIKSVSREEVNYIEEPISETFLYETEIEEEMTDSTKKERISVSLIPADFVLREGTLSLTLGETFNDAHKTVDTIMVSSGIEGEEYYKIFKHSLEGLAVYTTNRGTIGKEESEERYRISQIDIKSKNYKTSRGIKIGDSKEDIEKIYGRFQIEEKDKISYVSGNKTLNFHLNFQGMVCGISMVQKRMAQSSKIKSDDFSIKSGWGSFSMGDMFAPPEDYEIGKTRGILGEYSYFKHIDQGGAVIYCTSPIEKKEYTISRIIFQNTNYSCSSGIEVGSTKDDIKMAYGTPDYKWDNNIEYSLENKNLIITFDESGLVFKIEMKVNDIRLED